MIYILQESDTADVSTSILDIVVGREQRGQQLACRAAHSLLPPEAPLYTLLTLDVLREYISIYISHECMRI